MGLIQAHLVNARPEPYVPALTLSRDQPIMLLFYLLCYAAVLLKFTYIIFCSIYYAQEQELWLDYSAFYVQVCRSN